MGQASLDQAAGALQASTESSVPDRKTIEGVLSLSKTPGQALYAMAAPYCQRCDAPAWGDRRRPCALPRLEYVCLSPLRRCLPRLRRHTGARGAQEAAGVIRRGKHAAQAESSIRA